MWADTAGRVPIGRVEVHGRKVALISADAPNTFDKDFYDTLTKKMLE